MLQLGSSMEMDDEVVCSVCNKRESDVSKVLTCMYCFSSAHFKCKNVIGGAIRRMRENDYFCTRECSDIYQRIVVMQNSKNSLVSSLAAEMKATISASVAKEMQSVTTEVKQITTAIEKSQTFLSDKFDDIVTEFKDLKIENEKLKAEIDCLKKSQNQLKSTVSKLEANVDKSEKSALENNAILWGIPTTPDENVSQLVEKLLRSLGISGTSGIVSSSERIFFNSKNSNALVPIRIVFCSKESKETVFAKKKQLGKLLSTVIDYKFVVNGRALNVTLRDELTPLSLELLKELRESQELLNIKYIWAGRGGVILAKKDDNSKPDLVKNRDDLRRVISSYTKCSRAIECAPAPGHSPSPKRKKSTQ